MRYHNTRTHRARTSRYSDRPFLSRVTADSNERDHKGLTRQFRDHPSPRMYASTKAYLSRKQLSESYRPAIVVFGRPRRSLSSVVHEDGHNCGWNGALSRAGVEFIS